MTFTPANQGQTQCREITVTDDLLCEGDETIPVLLSTNEEPSEVRLSPPTATVVITDNDCMSLHYMLHKIMSFVHVFHHLINSHRATLRVFAILM